jgi:hypothetical protein
MSFEIFGQNDAAAELILANRDKIDRLCDHRRMLDALVPTVRGKKLSYDEYIGRFFKHDPMLRSVPDGSREEIFAAARQLGLQLIQSPRGRWIAAKLRDFSSPK